MNPENKVPFNGNGHEFQKTISYKDFYRSPPVVTRQTNAILELLHQRALEEPESARDYLQEYTLSYLRQAENGSDTVYNRRGECYSDLHLEITEAASHAFIVFAHLPDKVTSQFLSMGFSRGGMLKAPETKEEYLKRIEEIKIGILSIVEGRVNPHTTLEAYPRLLRTFGFFKVGAELTIDISEIERRKKQTDNEKLNQLLEGINVSL